MPGCEDNPVGQSGLTRMQLRPPLTGLTRKMAIAIGQSRAQRALVRTED